MLAVAVALLANLAALQNPSADPRIRALRDLIEGKAGRPLEAASISLIAQGLDSDAALVRRAALETLHAFAYIGNGKRGRSAPEAWAREKARLLTLKPRIVAALADADERARDYAVLALGTLDGTRGPHGEMIASVDAMNHLARRLPVEPSLRVRVQIVRSFALMADKGPGVPTERVLLAALDDPEPDVVQMGVAGIGRAQLAKHLPRLVPLLRHPNQGISGTAALSFSRLAEHAGPFLPDLQRAADAAPDGPFKQTLLEAIRLIREKAGR